MSPPNAFRLSDFGPILVPLLTVNEGYSAVLAGNAPSKTRANCGVCHRAELDGKENGRYDSRRLHHRFAKQDAGFVTRPAFLCLNCAQLLDELAPNTVIL